MSSTGRRVLFAVTPVVVLLAATEGVLRVAWDPSVKARIEQDGTPMVPHPSRIWGLDPQDVGSFGASYTIDADGLRATTVEGHELRALTLGDSSVFGHGLMDDQTLHARTEEALARHGLQVDVMTGAVPGYSTEQALAVLDEVGWDRDPDLLIIGTLWSDNGIRNFSDREWMATLGASGLTPERLFERSYIVRFGRRQLKPATDEALPVDWVRDPLDERRRRVLIDEYAENLETMMLQAADRGVSVVFLSPCNRALLYEFADRPTVWDSYFDAMELLAARRGVPVVSGCEVLRGMQVQEDDAFLDAMHPTSATNTLYANALAAELLAAGWPDQPILPDASVPRWTEPLSDELGAELTRTAPGGRVDPTDITPR